MFTFSGRKKYIFDQKLTKGSSTNDVTIFKGVGVKDVLTTVLTKTRDDGKRGPKLSQIA